MTRPLRPTALRSSPLLFLLLLCSMTTFLPRAAAADPPPVPLAASVDLPRFMGDWYVIAHIAPDADRDAHNAVEHYELVDGRVETTYRRRPGGFEAPEKIETPVGYVREGSGNALWGMRFWWWFPIRLEFRIAHLEPDYSVTIIGRSRRDYVWLMSRTPQMSDADYERYRALIASWGYDTSELVRVPQRWP
jgi:apolipoprotein D and lipocalin family protein